MASGHVGLACVVNMVLQHHALQSQALGATLQLTSLRPYYILLLE